MENEHIVRFRCYDCGEPALEEFEFFKAGMIQAQAKGHNTIILVCDACETLRRKDEVKN